MKLLLVNLEVLTQEENSFAKLLAKQFLEIICIEKLRRSQFENTATFSAVSALKGFFSRRDRRERRSEVC